MSEEKRDFITITLKSGHRKSIMRHHPWIFSGAIAGFIGKPTSGETVLVRDSFGEFVAWGSYSPKSKIRVRVYSWHEGEMIDRNFFERRLLKAIDYRKQVIDLKKVNSYRMINAESDGLPGLVVDKYDNVIVMQVLSAGIEKWREVIADLLMKITGVTNIFERSDVEVRKLEGLPIRKGNLRGNVPEDLIKIEENDLMFLVDIREGHKTGFYLDQRENRRTVQDISFGKHVLDCFSYTGGFTLAALKGGAASITAVDSSTSAISLAKQNLQINGFDSNKVNFIVDDVFTSLRKFRDRGMKFDLIILDPPKFAPTINLVERASRGYKDINLLAFKLLNQGGKLITFSCSGAIDPELFQKIVAGAALDAGVNGRISKRLFQGVDHPVSLSFPDGLYLKGFVINID